MRTWVVLVAIVGAAACVRNVVPGDRGQRARLETAHREEVRAMHAAMAPATKAAREAADSGGRILYLLREEARAEAWRAILAPADRTTIAALDRRLMRIRDSLAPLVAQPAEREQQLDRLLARTRATSAAVPRDGPAPLRLSARAGRRARGPAHRLHPARVRSAGSRAHEGGVCQCGGPVGGDRPRPGEPPQRRHAHR